MGKNFLVAWIWLLAVIILAGILIGLLIFKYFFSALLLMIVLGWSSSRAIKRPCVKTDEQPENQEAANEDRLAAEPTAYTREDAWVLTALLLAPTPATLTQLMAVGDWLNHAILMAEEVNHALSILHANGYLQVGDNGEMILTDDAKAIKDHSFDKTRGYDKVKLVHRYLIRHTAVPPSEIKEYFTHGDLGRAYREYTKGW